MDASKTDTNAAAAWDAFERVRLPNLSASAFVSDTDRAALENIQKIPLLPHIVRKFHELALDKISYARNSAESVRCGPNQFKTVHKMLRESCSVLHITEPELYIKQSESFNAYTSGTNQTFIVLHTALVDHFTDDELLFVIGHECGHIKAGHVLYQELGQMLLPLLEIVGQATLGLGQLAGIGLVAAFYEWMRQAELSCDRAGLLVSQNPRGSLAALMKLGGVSTRFQSEANLDAFLDQARNHAQTSGLEGLSKALLFVMYNWQLSHPQVVYRAKGLDEWIERGTYQQILNGNYARDMTGATQLGQLIKCPRCSKQVSAGLSFCSNCGQDLHPERASGSAFIPCPRCQAPLSPGTRFCPNCGAPVEQREQSYYPSTVGAPPVPPPPPLAEQPSVVDSAKQGIASIWNAARDIIQPAGSPPATPTQPPGMVQPPPPVTPEPPVSEREDT